MNSAPVSCAAFILLLACGHNPFASNTVKLGNIPRNVLKLSEEPPSVINTGISKLANLLNASRKILSSSSFLAHEMVAMHTLFIYSFLIEVKIKNYNC
jgi:hypothetical protein